MDCFSSLFLFIVRVLTQLSQEAVALKEQMKKEELSRTDLRDELLKLADQLGLDLESGGASWADLQALVTVLQERSGDGPTAEVEDLQSTLNQVQQRLDKTTAALTEVWL